jgi:6,7-dimethyl-8-ribityllumazine synthase
MSGTGAPERDTVDGSGLDIVIVAGQWHETIANGLLDGARRALDAAGASYRVVPVPGSFELPVVAKAALDAGADAVVALGVIIRGGTPHFEFVSPASPWTPESPSASAC